MNTTLQDSVRSRFFAPLKLALASASSRRHCAEFPDEEFLRSGVGRVINNVQSGRDWVQKLQMSVLSKLSVCNFFESLKSPRRLKLIEEVAAHLCQQLDRDCDAATDPLAVYPELESFAVYASDGHYEEACTHAQRIDGRTQAAGYFYSLNLRTHSMALLDIARPKHKREHDMSVLKRLGSTQLRLHAPKGIKVIHVYDPAGIDYLQWYRWKAKGVYMISREKENSKAMTIGICQWDETDPNNNGIISDEYVSPASGGMLLRRIKYRDPATNTEYCFLTNEMTLPPGLIAFLYKLRWDIEKVFDEKKTKLGEKKAWAKSPVAHCQQAHFLCLAHNLLVLFERQLQTDEGIEDTKVLRRKMTRLAAAEKLIRSKGLTPNVMVHNCTRITQRSLQYIRWLRHFLDVPTLYSDALAVLRPLMRNYLT